MLVKDENKIQLVCTICKKQVTRSKKEYDKLLRRNSNYTFICKTCKTKQTNLERYGVESVLQAEIVKNKIATTCLERYGTEHPAQNEKIKEKAKETCLERYGVSAPMQSKVIQEKSKETCLKQLGVEFPSQSKDVKEKVEKTNLERYGFRRASMSDKVKEKVKETCKSLYGSESFSQTDLYKKSCKNTWKNKSKENIEAIVQKREATCLEKLGVKNPSQSEVVKAKKKLKRDSWDFAFKKNVRSKQCKKYTYENINFDSSWELAVWIYAKDLGIYIEREPCAFVYEVLKEKHEYFPDFKFGNKLIEIKGGQFISLNETWINPYVQSEDLNKIYKAKQDCAIQNGVEIWSKKELQPILQYVKCKYGKDFLKKFKND